MIDRAIRWRVNRGAAVLLICAGMAWAQDSGGAQYVSSPDETVGVRFTPGMARGISRQLQSFLNRYEMPADKMDEASEKIARRIMEAAHAMDGRGQELLMRFVEEQLAGQLEGGVLGGGFMPPKFGKEFADRTLELTPAIKNFMRGYAQDIRPMLPFKQQLKFAAEMMAACAGVDAFEQTMHKWSSGEIQDFEDPFRSKREIKKDENGQSEELRNAHKITQKQLDDLAESEWDQYVQNFKKFYGLDAPQCTTADSILREYKQRAEQRKRDATWRERYYRDRMWLNIFHRVPNGWSHPVRLLLEDDQEDAVSWKETLGKELKTRLDTIPTGSQRRNADERIENALRENGIVLEGDAE